VDRRFDVSLGVRNLVAKRPQDGPELWNGSVIGTLESCSAIGDQSLSGPVITGGNALNGIEMGYPIGMLPSVRQHPGSTVARRHSIAPRAAWSGAVAPERVLGDRAYDAEYIRHALRTRQILPRLAMRNTKHGSGLGRWLPADRAIRPPCHVEQTLLPFAESVTIHRTV
jgi:hypothetical protein